MNLIVINKKNTTLEFARSVADQLGIPCVHADSPTAHDCTHVLWIGVEGLALGPLGGKPAAATRVDFLDPTLLYRLRTSGKRQGIGKAVGLDKASGISVLDATAGLGRDALVLAHLGCNVQMLEKSPVIHVLLEDGLRRALAEPGELLGPALRRMQLCHSDARTWFEDIQQQRRMQPDVIYLDPMFPPRSKSANVKKDIAMLQNILEEEPDFPGLLAAARSCARHRVVVKRPGSKPGKDVPEPTLIVAGKSAHFEVYVNSSFSSIRS
jgi:16S rRNA (guanine1516-N2)-methyltransferase